MASPATIMQFSCIVPYQMRGNISSFYVDMFTYSPQKKMVARLFGGIDGQIQMRLGVSLRFEYQIEREFNNV